MGLTVQLFDERDNFLFAVVGKISGLVTLISKTPENDRRMVIVLVDHRVKHGKRLPLVMLASEASAPPRYFLPNQQAEFIAEIKHRAWLLIMAAPDAMRAHLLNQLHLCAYKIIRHARPQARMVFFALCASQQQPFAIQPERSMGEKLKITNSKPLAESHGSVRAGQSNFATI